MRRPLIVGSPPSEIALWTHAGGKRSFLQTLGVSSSADVQNPALTMHNRSEVCNSTSIHLSFMCPGGYECQLDCDGTNHTGGVRMGGLMQGATIKAGEHIDSIELSVCTEDAEDI